METKITNNYLIKKFIKDYKNVKNEKVRKNYGVFASAIGIISNILLFMVKLTIGFLINSLAVIADSFNNLSDCLASIITLVAFKIAETPPDEDHPFGHGRVEYISSLIVAIFIALVAVEVLKSSIQKILHPVAIHANITLITILGLTAIVKLWQSLFYKEIGNTINSNTMLAASKDSFADVLITGATILSVGVTHFFKINIDGYMGLLITGFLFKATYEISMDTFSIIMGESPSEELCKEIKSQVESYDGILGVHDLIVHSYGPNRYLATLHAEVSCYDPILKSHALVDKAESEVGNKMGIHLTLHMDPTDTKDPKLDIIRNIVREYTKKSKIKIGAHDFRIVYGEEKINVIFDLEVPFSYTSEQSKLSIKEIVEAIKKLIINIIVL